VKNNKIPSLQFTRDESEWSWKCLKDISKKVTDKNKYNEYSETFTNSAELGIINQRDYFDKDISNKKNLHSYYIVKPDDFVYNPRISTFAPVGPIKRNKLGRTGVMSPLYYVFRTKDIELAYLESYFSSVKWHSFMKENGDSGARSDRIAIKDAVFGEMPIPYPSKKIQKEIATFFNNLDESIALHQQELDALKQTKKGFLHKMFPKEGNKTPEIRFPDFKSEWKDTTLNNMTNIIGGGTPDTKEPTFWDGEIDWYSPTEIGKAIYANGSARKITQLGLEKSSAKILPANKTILFTSRAGIGDTAILKKNGATNQGFQSLVVQNNCDIYFFYSMSEKIKKYALKNAAGSTFLEISGKNLGKMPILIPSFEEQSKIGEFFRQLDEVIELKEQELEALKQTKKGFLQKMFV